MKPLLRYWDSNAFLGWLNRDQDKFDACDQILADAEAGKCQIVTSTFTFVEVFFIKASPRILPDDQVKAITDLFGKSFVVPAEFDRSTALLARELLFKFARSHGLSPADATHLATAVKARSRGGVECFDTWDGPLSKLNGQLAGKIDALREKNSGADLYIGVPLIPRRLPYERGEAQTSRPKRS